MALKTGDPAVDKQLKDVQTRLEALEARVPVLILANEAIGTANTTIAHSLGRKPNDVIVLSTGGGTVTVVSMTDLVFIAKASVSTTATFLLV